MKFDYKLDKLLTEVNNKYKINNYVGFGIAFDSQWIK